MNTFSCIFLTSCLLLLCFHLECVKATQKLKEIYSWKHVEYAFPYPRMKQEAISMGKYLPRNTVPIGIERWANKMFITTPRWRDGIPAALNYIDMNATPSGSPDLMPYPGYLNTTAGDCANSITNTYRIKADKCDRLWVLDTGTIGLGPTSSNVCPYAINVFDLRTDKRLRRYEWRAEDINANTFVANIAVDIGKDCDDTHVYFSDNIGYGIVVYSWEKNKSWRFSSHSYFFPDPLRGDFNIPGLNYQFNTDGIFGMSLSPIQPDGYRTMYFSPMASHRQFAVSTEVLRNESRVGNSFHDFQALNERGPNSHTTARVMSDDGIELFNLIDQCAIGCWHSSLPYLPQFHGIADKDEHALIFPNDIKIDEEQNVWVLSNRLPYFWVKKIKYDEDNYRILMAPLKKLIENTVCDLGNATVFQTRMEIDMNEQQSQQNPPQQRPPQQRPPQQRPPQQRPPQQNPPQQRPPQQRPLQQNPPQQRSLPQRPLQQRPPQQSDEKSFDVSTRLGQTNELYINPMQPTPLVPFRSQSPTVQHQQPPLQPFSSSAASSPSYMPLYVEEPTQPIGLVARVGNSVNYMDERQYEPQRSVEPHEYFDTKTRRQYYVPSQYESERRYLTQTHNMEWHRQHPEVPLP